MFEHISPDESLKCVNIMIIKPINTVTQNNKIKSNSRKNILYIYGNQFFSLERSSID